MNTFSSKIYRRKGIKGKGNIVQKHQSKCKFTDMYKVYQSEFTCESQMIPLLRHVCIVKPTTIAIRVLTSTGCSMG